MKCEFCELAMSCTSPDACYGGCDLDGVDDRGCSSLDEIIDEYEASLAEEEREDA